VSASNGAAGLERLERQVERGSLFTHTALGEGFLRLGETAVTLHALLDLLLAKGLVSEDEVALAMGDVRAEMAARGELAGPGTAIRPDDPAEEGEALPAVDCAARLPVCGAVCCKLGFALSIPEVEAGAVRWDLGRPYFIRQEEDGWCTHVQRGSCACGVYESRPRVCRRYTCAGDPRVWKDFEGMVLNTEWIEAHLPPAAPPRRVGTLMAVDERAAAQPVHA
jgi:Fe-S-cluster containining protein